MTTQNQDGKLLQVSYKLKGNSTMNLGVSRRIKRPGIYKLNPFVDRSNPSFEFTGNPELMPSLINNLMVGYGISKKVSFNTGIGYSFFSKLDFPVSEYNPATNITRTTFKNIGRGYANNLDVNLNYPFGKRWNATINSSFVYINADGLNNGTLIKIDNVIYNVNISSDYRFNKDWLFISNLNMVGPNVISLQTTANSMLASGFTLTKEVMNRKLSLSATVNNPFTKYRNNRITTTGKNFLETNVTPEYFRNFGFSMNMRFGNLKEGIKKNRRGINNNDIGNNKGGL